MECCWCPESRDGRAIEACDGCGEAVCSGCACGWWYCPGCYDPDEDNLGDDYMEESG